MGNRVLDLKNLQLNILLVEDNKVDAFAVRRVLDKFMTHPCNVRHVETMADAEAVLAQKDYIDVILLDLGLPDTVDGKDTFRRMGGVKDDIPVIILTSADDHDLALLIVDSGAEDFVKKSMIADTPQILCDAIDFAVCRHKNLVALKERQEQELEEKNKIIQWVTGSYSVLE